MARKSNSEIIKTIVDNGTMQMQEIYERSVDMPVSGILDAYPTFKNEFLEVLTNRVYATEFYSTLFNNPLKFLKRGKAHGSIEQIHIDFAEMKGLFEHFDDVNGNPLTTDEADLIRRAQTNLKARYINNNFHLRGKSSYSAEQLRTACDSEYGLQNLIDTIKANSLTSVEWTEYANMRDTLYALAKYKNPTMLESGRVVFTEALTAQTAPQTMHVSQIEVGSTKRETMENLTEKIRELSEQWYFPSNEFAMADVRVNAKKEDLCFITTAKYKAQLDVQVLANAFNTTYADMKTRIIIVDKLPKATDIAKSTDGTCYASGEVYGFLIDRNFLAVYDNYVTTDSQRVASTLDTNIFTHVSGIMAACLFSNATVLATLQ